MIHFEGEGDSPVLVGLDAMFDGRKKGVFRAHQPVTKKDLDELELAGRPFYERFFNEHVEIEGKRGLDRLNLLLRLKLLASVEGESVELAVDYFAGKEPELYLINRLDPYRLHLGFDDFVAYFSKFGIRRWYYAFLDKKAEQAMNIDLRAELEASLADFDPADVAPLLARFPMVPVGREEGRRSAGLRAGDRERRSASRGPSVNGRSCRSSSTSPASAFPEGSPSWARSSSETG
jgi:hypothetical protein